MLVLGAPFETCAANEIAKQLTWCETPARLFHFRENNGAEVDLVVEADDGRVEAIEVNATSTSRRRTREEILALMDDISGQMEDVTGIDEELSRFRDDPHGG